MQNSSRTREPLLHIAMLVFHELLWKLIHATALHSLRDSIADESIASSVASSTPYFAYVAYILSSVDVMDPGLLLAALAARILARPS